MLSSFNRWSDDKETLWKCQISVCPVPVDLNSTVVKLSAIFLQCKTTSVKSQLQLIQNGTAPTANTEFRVHIQINTHIKIYHWRRSTSASIQFSKKLTNWLLLFLYRSMCIAVCMWTADVNNAAVTNKLNLLSASLVFGLKHGQSLKAR